MDFNKISELLKKNGYTISDVDNFNLFLRNGNQEEIIDHLNELDGTKEEMDLNKFTKKINGIIRTIYGVYNDDEVVSKSNPEVITKFEDQLRGIANKFAVVTSTLVSAKALENAKADLEEVSKRKDWIENINKPLMEFKQNKDLVKTPEGTSRYLQLLADQKAAREEYASNMSKMQDYYDTALNTHNKNLEEMNALKDSFASSDFKNDLIHDVNSLEDTTKELALSDNSKDKFNYQFGKLHDLVNGLGLSKIEAQDEFNSLCEKYGLSKNPEFVKMEESIEEKTSSDVIDNKEEPAKEDKEQAPMVDNPTEEVPVNDIPPVVDNTKESAKEEKDPEPFPDDFFEQETRKISEENGEIEKDVHYPFTIEEEDKKSDEIKQGEQVSFKIKDEEQQEQDKPKESKQENKPKNVVFSSNNGRHMRVVDKKPYNGKLPIKVLRAIAIGTFLLPIPVLTKLGIVAGMSIIELAKKDSKFRKHLAKVSAKNKLARERAKEVKGTKSDRLHISDEEAANDERELDANQATIDNIANEESNEKISESELDDLSGKFREQLKSKYIHEGRLDPTLDDSEMNEKIADLYAEDLAKENTNTEEKGMGL